MGRQIIKQPNGKYCIFSSIVDNITHYNMGEKDIVDLLVEEFRKKTEEDVKQIISSLEAGGKPYFQFTKSYEQMLETIKDIHEEKIFNEIKSLIEPPEQS